MGSAMACSPQDGPNLKRAKLSYRLVVSLAAVGLKLKLKIEANWELEEALQGEGYSLAAAWYLALQSSYLLLPSLVHGSRKTSFDPYMIFIACKLLMPRHTLRKVQRSEDFNKHVDFVIGLQCCDLCDAV